MAREAGRKTPDLIAEGLTTAGFFDPTWWRGVFGGKVWPHHWEPWETPHFAVTSTPPPPQTFGYMRQQFPKLTASPDVQPGVGPLSSPLRLLPSQTPAGGAASAPGGPSAPPSASVNPQVTQNMQLSDVLRALIQIFWNLFGARLLGGAPGAPGAPGLPGIPGQPAPSATAVGGGGGAGYSGYGGSSVPYSISSLLMPSDVAGGGSSLWDMIGNAAVQVGTQYAINKLTPTTTPSLATGFVGPVQPGYDPNTGLPMAGMNGSGGACAVQAPFRAGGMVTRSTPQAHAIPNPSSGKLQWFVPARITGWKMTHVRRRRRCAGKR